jgi:Phage portal protein, SPP1 Gp6-like
MASELSPQAQEILAQNEGVTRTQEFLREMSKRDSKRLTDYKTFEDYYSGENQRVRLTDRVRRFLNVSGFMWCENFCEVVVDSMCERLILQKMTSDEQVAVDWADEWWETVRMDEMQSIVHTNTAIKGDGYVIVDLDTRTGQPTVHWNRPEIIKPIYDEEHPETMLFASKVWKSQLETPTNPNQRPITRMNLYFANKVEKWFSESADAILWGKHLDPGDTTWPIPWTDTGEDSGQPLGVPVFHFRNKSKGKTWGVSEIRGTIPQQDGLNKQVLDLIMVLDQHGFPQRWGTGIKKEERSSLTGSAGTMWLSANPEARFGQFDMGDVSGCLKAIEAALQRLAGRSRTPLFLLVLAGDAPSGESLKTAESGLVAKIKDRRVSLGSTWEDVYVMAAKVAASQGKLAGIEINDDLFEAVWADPESRNELEQRTALGIEVTQLGLSKHTALEQLGYNADEETDRKDQETAQAVLNFNRGTPTEPVGLPVGAVDGNAGA